LPFAGEPNIGEQPVVELREAATFARLCPPVDDASENATNLAKSGILG
jgi:hypothetical protein